jgi:hypothetical protein
MKLSNSIYLGIDPTSSHKAFTYAMLDRELNLIAIENADQDDLAALLSQKSPTVVAINAPAALSRGLVRQRVRDQSLAPHQIRGAEMRLAEYELRERGIIISKTPASLVLCPSWMQVGFGLYRKLEKMGYKKYPDPEDSFSQILETHPHACFSVLGGNVPQAKPSLEGRMQRQLLLYERGVRIKDPMDFFEEITRYKMIQGQWPVDLLYLPEQLDAMVAAFTAWLAMNKPNQITRVGNEAEGYITLPEKELKEKY